MATVVLSYAGAAVGTMLGGPIGGIIGRALGGIAGNMIDQQLFTKTQRVTGPRLQDLRVQASEEGAPVPVIWGRMRLSGQVIWAANIEEVKQTDSSKAGGKGGPKVKTTTYSYFASFAVGLCEGEIDGIGRVWADGKLLDIAPFTTRLYTGSETQPPDSLIETVEGASLAPAYRGLAYIVFERLPLERFGNRIPQLSFEVMRAGSDAADAVRGVNIIPGATEFGYDTTIVTRTPSKGVTEQENAHLSSDRTDFTLSMDQLQATCKNLGAAALVVAWFGDDLRCGQCSLKPKTDNAGKITKGATWRVSGLERANADVVSINNGGVAYGGTPSDDSVVNAIRDLKARGLTTVFYPFVLMDIPQDNQLPDPYGGTAQAAYPWRGRITSSIAPGRAGTPDKTATAATELAGFVGTATPSNFSVNGTTVTYSGAPEWSYRRMILHYAKLCAAAGGVDAFLIGSELRGLTTLRSAAATYPFVAALQALASEVKAILPEAKISYAADWTEWFGHHPQDGSGDVFFHLDPLWASSAIDFIGIDNYMPLSDWRDGAAHLDAVAGTRSIHDLEYLKSNIAGGEGFDWYYASDAARLAQTRTPITDGAAGKPWVFRYKDLRNWWLNPHFNRPGGSEVATPTVWTPQSKPFWFTEVGCPAIDKGTNQPNVFVDEKSAESAMPYFSGGQRDDAIQLLHLRALHDHWSGAGAHNPVSSVYGQNMVDPARIFNWAWDARPFPAFPARTDIWSDGSNFARGHWLNGRLGAVELSTLVQSIADRFGLVEVETDELTDMIDGFVLDRPMTGRDALEQLLAGFAIDAVESEGKLKFVSRKTAVATSALDVEDLAELAADTPLLSETRQQEADLPRAVRLSYLESGLDYRPAAVSQQRTGTASAREISMPLPAAMLQATAQMRADVALEEAWAARATARFALPPSWLALEPGDVVTLGAQSYRIAEIADGEARKVEAVAFTTYVYDPPPAPQRGAGIEIVAAIGSPEVVLMDLAAGEAQPVIAAQAAPWPGPLAVLKATDEAGFTFNRTIEAAATMGETLTALPSGKPWRVDWTHDLSVQLHSGALSSASRDALLAGANTAAIGTEESGFEIIQFERAELTGPKTYKLSGLLRAQAGSAAEMQTLRGIGQSFVLLNAAAVPVTVTLDEASLPSRWRVGPASQDQGHASYVERDIAPTLRALRPLPPVHLRARTVSGDVVISWIRQTRLGGDSWELAEVPLSEDAEAYSLEVLDGTSVVRRFDCATNTCLYTNADITTDFGVLPPTLTLRVAQVSALIGAGTPLERTIHV